MEAKFTATDLIKSSIEVQRHLTDELSRQLYEARLKYLINRDKVALKDDMLKLCQTVNETSKLNFISEKNIEFDTIVIFGAGVRGHSVLKILQNSKYRSKSIVFCDNNVEQNVREVVISPDKLLENYKNIIVIVAASVKNRIEINRQLMEMDFPTERIITSSKLIGWQYFDYFQPNENEVFVDAGALDGLTALDFKDWASKGYNYIYSFEANPEMIKPCENVFRNCNLTGEVINKGLWNKREVICFNINEQPGESKIIEDGNMKIEAVPLDEILKGKRATLIKMDIEGAEFKALLGCKQTIAKWRPRLAISIYHKPEDILEIPALLLEMQPDYQFALRHYSFGASETILYAY